MKCVSHFCNYYKVQHPLMAKLEEIKSRINDEPQTHMILTLSGMRSESKKNAHL